MQQEIDNIAVQIQEKPIAEAIRQLTELFPGQVAFSTSFGHEDQVISDIIFKNRLPVRVFTLDTGRMFEETYQTFYETQGKYKQNIEVYFPDKASVEKLVTEKGPYSFYESVENRKQCCFIRKIEPLKRALQGVKIWITGLRGGQSENRQHMHNLEWDEGNQLIKYNPLITWTLEEVEQYIDKNRVPYNKLYNKGFKSIGCAPCTRAIEPGEDLRAGRWWWEVSHKECGLHESSSSEIPNGASSSIVK
ncbi:phosphoadenylyl-sulfate reductase [Xanthocytophaga agilis]|uniref:Adenosine 5'-phosphosulfate reductase n=1 Tax=Xanthocytophaga agilis TaxID=3048010 RepID=A0AAE3R7N1_9BACT|nr:phosphoadenylyl-sulfate reductase [Xanthocytophaga agilis]MDJ1502930.1 phosphoadenylyl-sulfate reductase [Xanthocytophaga agilis]